MVGISHAVWISWCCGAGTRPVCVAVGLGIRARSEIRAAGGAQGGAGVAMAGIVTGAVAAVLGLLVLVALVVVVISGNAAFQDYADYTG